MTGTIGLLTILLTSLASAADPLPLPSDNYTLKVTEEVTHPKVANPFAKIPNDEYRPAKKQKALSLRFSKDRKKVEILPRGVSGELTSSDGKKRVYKLSKGLFAGGQLIVERTKKGLVTTFTEFGSGVLVTSSKRGGIKPTARKAKQEGADKPATAPESKPEGAKNPEPESDESSQ